MQKLGISNLHIYIPVFLSMLGTDELLHFSRKKKGTLIALGAVDKIMADSWCPNRPIIVE